MSKTLRFDVQYTHGQLETQNREENGQSEAGALDLARRWRQFGGHVLVTVSGEPDRVMYRSTTKYTRETGKRRIRHRKVHGAFTCLVHPDPLITARD